MARTKAPWLARWSGGTGWGIYGSGQSAQRMIRVLITLDNDPGRTVEIMLSPSEARSLGRGLFNQADKVDAADDSNPLHPMGRKS
jgi:hypothetical protein